MALDIRQAVDSRQGFDVLLVDPAKGALLCPECDLVLRDAIQTPEGIRLCEPCFKQIAKLPNYKSLKTGILVSGEDGKPACFPDKAVRREVQQLQVKCKNIIYGCSWCGTLTIYFESHLASCKYIPVNCSNVGCDKLLSRDQLKKHLAEECQYRNIQCEHCKELVMPINLEEHHSKCDKFPVKCEHCAKMVPRDQVGHHNLSDCPTIKCTCGTKLKRGAPAQAKDSVESHLKKPADILQHILSIDVLLNSVIRSNGDIGRRLKSVETGGLKGPKNSIQQAELAQFRAEIEQNFHTLTDRLSPLEQYQSGASKDKNMNGKITELQSKLRHIEEKNRQQEIQIRSLQTQMQQRAVTASLTTTTENIGEVDQSRVVQLEKRYEDMERQMSLLKVHVSELELQLQASLASTHNGSFLWRIPDIPRRKRDAVEERITSIYSPPFYTGRNGYKMCIRAYLNGDGAGYKTHLSLFFVVMKGEFDALLKWPFDYKVSLILVDQNHRKHIVQTFKPTPESSSFQRPASDMNVASGCPQFAKLSVLEDNSYVTDEVLYIKCIVDTSRIFHP